MPYLCMVRADIPDGTLQVLDLDPNTSQRSLIYDPPGQTKYVNRTQNDTVATTNVGGVITTNAVYTGVTAYLIDNCESAGLAAGTGALTAAFANTIGLALIARMDAGNTLTLAAVNAVIQATAVNTELTPAGGSLSTGSITELLQIMAGDTYTVTAGTSVEAAGSANLGNGAFGTTTYRSTYDTGALKISFSEGAVSEMIAATFTYLGTAGAALVAYSDAGAIYTV